MGFAKVSPLQWCQCDHAGCSPRPDTLHNTMLYACLQPASHRGEGSNSACVAHNCKQTHFQESIRQLSSEVYTHTQKKKKRKNKRRKENLGRIFLGVEHSMKFGFQVKCFQAGTEQSSVPWALPTPWNVTKCCSFP